jgi:hypothetical protein
LHRLLIRGKELERLDRSTLNAELRSVLDDVCRDLVGDEVGVHWIVRALTFLSHHKGSVFHRLVYAFDELSLCSPAVLYFDNGRVTVRQVEDYVALVPRDVEVLLDPESRRVQP